MTDHTFLAALVVTIVCTGSLLCLWIVWGNRRMTAMLLCAAYVWQLLFLTVFRRLPYPVHRALPIPFQSYRVVLHGPLTAQGLGMAAEMVGNVLVFVPLGLILSCLFRGRRRVWTVLGIGLVCSLLIEGIQYFSYVGFFETDDLIHNTLGTLLGFRLGAALRRHREEQEQEGILSVLDAIELPSQKRAAGE